MRNSIVVGGQHFKTKTALRDYIRAIVAKHGDNQPIEGDDFDFIVALFGNHPQAQTKFGCGVNSITIRRNPQYPSTRGFYLKRIDGSETDVSWTECLNPTPHRKKVIRALRALIEEQTMEFKNRYFNSEPFPVCELTGQPIQFVGSHVDHVSPFTFEKLVEDFCALFSLDVDTIPLRDELADNKYVDVLDVDVIAVLWQEYHRQHAKLRVISALGNLSHAKVQA